jgi:hypothetical protein
MLATCLLSLSDRLNWLKNIDKDLKSQPPKFWKYASSFRKINSYLIQLDVSDSYIMDPGEVAEGFTKHFQSVYNTSLLGGCHSGLLCSDSVELVQYFLYYV